jgi:hypothetical protein
MTPQTFFAKFARCGIHKDWHLYSDERMSPEMIFPLPRASDPISMEKLDNDGNPPPYIIKLDHVASIALSCRWGISVHSRQWGKRRAVGHPGSMIQFPSFSANFNPSATDIQKTPDTAAPLMYDWLHSTPEWR